MDDELKLLTRFSKTHNSPLINFDFPHYGNY
jgi:hypothetical protein